MNLFVVIIVLVLIMKQSGHDVSGDAYESRLCKIGRYYKNVPQKVNTEKWRIKRDFEPDDREYNEDYGMLKVKKMTIKNTSRAGPVKYMPIEKTEDLVSDPVDGTKYFPDHAFEDGTGPLITKEGVYSITGPTESMRTVEEIRKRLPDVASITDATANVGGDSIRFGMEFDRVQSVEIDPATAAVLQHNVDAFGLGKKIKVCVGDYIDVGPSLEQDVVYFDPPWGGQNYRYLSRMGMKLGEMDIVNVIRNIVPASTKMIVLKSPFNFADDDMVKRLGPGFNVEKIIYKLYRDVDDRPGQYIHTFNVYFITRREKQ